MPPKRKVTTQRKGTSHWWDFSSSLYPGAGDGPYQRLANTEDNLVESHGHPYHLIGKGPGDIGGDFKVTHQTYAESASSRELYTLTGWPSPEASGKRYQGNFWARTADVGIASSVWPSPPVSSKAQLHSYGTTAISRCAPTNPLASLSTFLGEAREGIPSLVGVNAFKNRSKFAKSAGDEFLNIEFGWKPLVSDIRSFLSSAESAERLTKQYEKNSGKLLRRHYEFPTQLTITVQNQGNFQPDPVLDLYFYSGVAGARTLTTTTKVERWFDGAFTYYLPPLIRGGNNSRRQAQLRNYLYGTRVNPETLWNIAPWTWAADWVTNFGDVIHNVSQFSQDGLVMPYGYMMERSSVTHHYHTVGCLAKTHPYRGIRTGPFTQTFTTEVKQRVKATPYGFGLDPALNFTERQWSIVSALGLSKGGKRSL